MLFDLETISKKTKISMNILKKYFQKKGSLSSEKLKKICNIINTDPSSMKCPYLEVLDGVEGLKL